MTLGKSEETETDDWKSVERRKNEHDRILQVEVVFYEISWGR